MKIELNEIPALLFENNHSGLFVTDLSGKLLECNPAFVEIFGYDSKTDILSVNSVEFHVTPSNRQKYIEDLKVNGELTNYAFKSKRKNGETFDALINVKLYKTDSLRESLLIGSVVDQTDTIQNNLKIQESEKKYRDLFENSMEIIQSFDSTGKFLYCNKRWHELLEYTPEEASQLTFFHIVDPSYHQNCGELFQMVISGVSLNNISVVFVSKSGKKMDMEGNVVPLMEGGKVTATHAFFRDVTERNKYVKKITDQEHLLNSLFNTVPINLYLKHESGKYILANKAMKETLQTEVENKFDNDVFADVEICEKLKSTDHEALINPNAVINYEIEIKTPEKSRNFFCGKKSIVDNENNKQIFGFSIDISEQKQLIARLNKKIVENEILMGEIHHRVKNNLAVIDGILEFKKSSSKDPETSDFLSDIQLRVKSIALVHQKLYANQNFSSINIADYISDLTDFYTKLINKNQAKKLDFSLKLTPFNLSIAQAINFGLLLSELISNSCKYAFLDGKLLITLSMVSEPNGFSFIYRDTGLGLKSNHKGLQNGGFGFKLITSLIKQNKGEIVESNFDEIFMMKVRFTNSSPH